MQGLTRRIRGAAPAFLAIFFLTVLHHHVCYALTESRITSNSAHQLHPAISGNRVVWVDLRNDAGAPTDDPATWTNSDIYSYDLGSPVLDGTRITTDSKNQNYPDISGNRIVWEDWRNSPDASGNLNSDIYLHDLSTGATYPLCVAPRNQLSPAIEGSRVVWMDSRNYYWDVYMYDLSVDTDGDGIPNYRDPDRPSPDPAEYRITPDRTLAQSPTIAGNVIVWTDTLYWDVFLYDLGMDSDSDGIPNYREVPRPAPDPALVRIDGQVAARDSSAVSHGKIVWRDGRNGAGNTDIYLYDLGNPVPNGLQLSSNMADQGSPAVYSNIVVWEDSRTLTSKDIYAYDLRTRLETVVTANSSNQYSPDVWGDVVVWEDRRNGNGDIYLARLGIDNLAPNAAGDLRVVSSTSSSITLSWTAPGDNGSTGTAATYDVRYSTSLINDVSWASATQATGEPAPKLAGSSETFTVTGLSSATTYYFAMKTADAAGNWSYLSNVPSAQTASTATIPLGVGWNLVSLPHSPVTAQKAQDVLNNINASAGSKIATQISKWDNASGTWVSRIDGLPPTINNFNVVLGEGYFIKVSSAGSWSVIGTHLTAPVTINLGTGWNLTAVPYSATSYKAQDLINAIKAQGGTASQVSKWDNASGTWVSRIDGLPLTINNFNIVPGEGYFIKTASSSTFTP